MTAVILARLWSLVPTLLITSIVVFAMTLLIPGDPTTAILGEEASAAERALLRRELGLDDPIPVQYFRWLTGFASGDLGVSLRTKEPVLDMILQRAPVTAELALLAIVLSVAVGIPLGVLSGLKRNTPLDTVASTLALTSLAVPYFWAGILLIMVFAVGLGWFPASGYVPWSESPAGNLQSMALPAVSVGTSMAALVMRQTRGSLIECMAQDYIRTARAKGASESRVVLRHGLRNALVPVATVVGLQASVLISGAVVTETVFLLPGLGRMIVDAIFWRDFAVVQGGIVVVVVGVLLVNLLTDILCMWLDPRIQS